MEDNLKINKGEMVVQTSKIIHTHCTKEAASRPEKSPTLNSKKQVTGTKQVSKTK